jgi:hypothetical protein
VAVVDSIKLAAIALPGSLIPVALTAQHAEKEALTPFVRDNAHPIGDEGTAP